jgi:hypothetical protein
MKSNDVDVYFHVQQKVPPQVVADVSRQVAQVSGVVEAVQHARMSRLIAVKYNPGRTSSAAILNAIRANGYAATMFGM